MERHNHPHNHQHYTIGQLANHLRTWHKDDDGSWELWEHHEHFSTIKVGHNYAARIDVHPWAMDRLKTHPPVIFAGMEGCLKADSILSSILREDLPASVYSFPSVTLGKCPELPRFADEFLQDKTVVAVLDADWADPTKEGAVENQGRIYQARLLELGIPRVHLAAPPQGTQKGVDDFLGIGEGHLSQLVCIDVDPPDFMEVESWVRAVAKEDSDKDPRWDTVNRATNMLRSMAVFSGVSKRLSVTLSCMANVMGLTQPKVTEYLQRFDRWGAVEIDGILDTGPSWFGGFDWERRPTIRLIPDVLQATVLPERTLEQVLGPSFFGRS